MIAAAAVMVLLAQSPAQSPDVLTLTASTHWSPPAVLDTTQVEAPPETDLPVDCIAVDAMTLPEQAVHDLIAFGWFADPTDGEEVIYSPQCVGQW